LLAELHLRAVLTLVVLAHTGGTTLAPFVTGQRVPLVADESGFHGTPRYSLLGVWLGGTEKPHAETGIANGAPTVLGPLHDCFGLAKRSHQEVIPAVPTLYLSSGKSAIFRRVPKAVVSSVDLKVAGIPVDKSPRLERRVVVEPLRTYSNATRSIVGVGFAVWVVAPGLYPLPDSIKGLATSFGLSCIAHSFLQRTSPVVEGDRGAGDTSFGSGSYPVPVPHWEAYHVPVANAKQSPRRERGGLAL